MTNYEKFVTQAQEGVLQAAKQLTKAQEQAIAALKEAQGNATAGLPSAAQLVEANYAFTSQVLQIQKELTLRWVEAAAPAAEPAKPGKGGSASSN
jgi:hypothetical protein